MSRILVIGGTGFLGRFVLPQLVQRDHEIAVLQRRESRAVLPPDVGVIQGDRRQLNESASALRAFKPQIVIDVILSSGAQAETLVQVCRGVAERIVAISSIDVYRACGVLHGSEEGPLEPLPLTEDSPLRTKLQTYPPAQLAMLKGVFGWLDDDYDKIPVERAIMSDHELAGTVLRLPMIYGPGDPLHRWYSMIRRMDDRRPAIIMPASLAAWRSPRGYVENVAAAVALAASTPSASGRIYNVAERESFSEHEWTRLVAEEAGWRGDIVAITDRALPASMRMPGRLEQHWVADSTRIRRELRYEEPVARTEAILRTIEWERANPPLNVEAQRVDYETENRILAEHLGAALSSLTESGGVHSSNTEIP